MLQRIHQLTLASVVVQHPRGACKVDDLSWQCRSTSSRNPNDIERTQCSCGGIYLLSRFIKQRNASETSWQTLDGRHSSHEHTRHTGTLPAGALLCRKARGEARPQRDGGLYRRARAHRTAWCGSVSMQRPTGEGEKVKVCPVHAQRALLWKMRSNSVKPQTDVTAPLLTCIWKCFAFGGSYPGPRHQLRQRKGGPRFFG